MIVAANLKTNHTRAKTSHYINDINSFLIKQNIQSKVYVFPSASSLDAFNTETNLTIGTQNAYPIPSGSFTGEIGSEQLSEFNITTILIGHSERRMLGDDDRLVLERYNYFKELGYTIILCIGESLSVRESGIKSIQEFLSSQLESIDLTYNNLIIAYEPIWAIGTGVTATPQQVSETLDFLRKKIKKPLLYGGSVKPANMQEICEIENCDGVLVGTASWDSESFIQMIEIGENVK